jgi:hypothetical protein
VEYHIGIVIPDRGMFQHALSMFLALANSADDGCEHPLARLKVHVEHMIDRIRAQVNCH